MAIEHVDIVDSERHEPKGASTAPIHTMLVSTGSGTTSFALVDADNIDTTSIKNTNKFKVNIRIDDISTAQTVYVPLSDACTFNGATTVLAGAIGTADADITFKNTAGTTINAAMAVGFSGSAAGDVDTFTASTNNTFTAGSYLTVETDGASTNTVPLYIELNFTLT